MEKPEPYHYNFHPLDRLLSFYDPEEIGDQLDEAMSDLVGYAAKNEGYCESLSERHNLLRELRDVFWKLQPTNPNDKAL